MKLTKALSAAAIAGALAAASTLTVATQATAGDSIRDRVSSYADKLDLSQGRSFIKKKSKSSGNKLGKYGKSKKSLKGLKKNKLSKGKLSTKKKSLARKLPKGKLKSGGKLNLKSTVRKLRSGNLDIAGRSISECSLYKWRWEKTGRYHWKERYDRCIH